MHSAHTREGKIILSALQNVPFRRVWFAQIFSETGDWIRNMALLLWVYQMTNGSALAVSVITVCEYVPILFVTPFAGVWVDRWPRVKTMIGADLYRALLIGLIGVGLYTHWLPLVYLSTLFAGCFQAFFDPARTAVVANIVPREQLVAANSLTQVTRNTIRVLGPMIGTGVYTLLGATLSFSFDALSFLLSAACLSGLLHIKMQVAATAKKQIISSLREGFAYTVKHPMLRPMLLAGLCMGLGLGCYNTLQIFVVTKSLGLPENYIAVLNSVQGVAMLSSALLIGSLARKIKHRHQLLTAGLLIIGIGIVLMAMAPNLALACLGRLVVGFGGTTLNIGLAALIQTFVSDTFLGRVSGLLEPLIVGSMTVSSALASPLMAWLSIRPLLVIDGAIVLIASFVSFSLFKIGQAHTETTSAISQS